MDDNLEEKKIAAKIATSEALAAQVVAYKVLGFNKEFAIFCMTELAKRRSLGENFDFETYIDTNVNKMPKPEVKDLRGAVGMMGFQKFINSIKPKA